MTASAAPFLRVSPPGPVIQATTTRAAVILSELRGHGFDFFTGVPCSALSALINGAQTDGFLTATSEGEAVALAGGSWLAGRHPVVMLQNSGLGNAVNPLTSLIEPCRIPLLLIVSWRGEPGRHDEPQHRVMGAVLPDLLRLVGVEPAFLDEGIGAATEGGGARALIARLGELAEESAFAVPASGQPPRGPAVDWDLRRGGARSSRYEVLEAIVAGAGDDTGIVSTTGKCSRELFTIVDRPQHFYTVGSMGFCSAIALGVSLHTDRRVIAVDGDGAALMHLGNFATIGARAPRNLVHVVLDNGVHDSTGGQETSAPFVDFARVAAACSYATASRCDDAGGLAEALARTRGLRGPHFIHVAIPPGSRSPLARPDVPPDAVARRFREFVLG
jgi:phosphonopyruvate decarboxylase